MNLVDLAYEFARKAHKGQFDDAGEDYFNAHIAQVYLLINLVTQDPDILSASLLHDTIENTTVTQDVLRRKFGDKITNLVVELTKASKGVFPALKSRDAILIKFADRLSNLSRMDCWSEERKQKYIDSSKFWKNE